MFEKDWFASEQVDLYIAAIAMPSVRPRFYIVLAFSLSLVSACRSSKTAKKIANFADEVCECKDAACAKAVQDTYYTWWVDHQRARGSEEDHKEVEGSMERFAKCYLDLVGEEKSTATPIVPKIDLSPPTEKTEAVLPAAPDSGTSVEPASDKGASPASDKGASPASDKSAAPASDKSSAPASDKSAAPKAKAPAGKATLAPVEIKAKPVSP